MIPVVDREQPIVIGVVGQVARRTEPIGSQACRVRGEVWLPEYGDGGGAAGEPVVLDVEDEDPVVAAIGDERAPAVHIDRDPDRQHARRDATADIDGKVETVARRVRVLGVEVGLAEHDRGAMAAAEWQGRRIDVVHEHPVVPAVADVEALVAVVVRNGQGHVHADP